ncbi:DUF3558 family protein [Qaidamihabitans albus]|uniref:DUF3558 family protein n=1 Tax=Qaidamihabitans albus TaxID=2795733 RepID=UPI0027DC9541|nr:DUF3558 family protein [Qaidamihabitans albus]
MRRGVRTLLIVVGVAVLPLTVTCSACGARPQAEQATRATASAATTAGSAEGADGADGVEGAEAGALPAPCELLSPAERSSAGLTVPGEPKTVGDAAACDYTEPGSFGITITVDERSGLADLHEKPGRATPVRYGDRQALRVADEGADDGTCAVLLAAGDSASVHIDVSNTNFSGTALACERAGAVAELVEPDLP